MIDAHLLLSLGRGEAPTVLRDGEAAPLAASAQAGKFADALRQVHAAGRQEAAAPMQLRIIGSALRVVTPARAPEGLEAPATPETPEGALLQMDSEGVPLALPEASTPVAFPSLKAKDAEHHAQDGSAAAWAVESSDRALRPQPPGVLREGAMEAVAAPPANIDQTGVTDPAAGPVIQGLALEPLARPAAPGALVAPENGPAETAAPRPISTAPVLPANTEQARVTEPAAGPVRQGLALEPSAPRMLGTAGKGPAETAAPRPINTAPVLPANTDQARVTELAAGLGTPQGEGEVKAESGTAREGIAAVPKPPVVADGTRSNLLPGAEARKPEGPVARASGEPAPATLVGAVLSGQFRESNEPGGLRADRDRVALETSPSRRVAPAQNGWALKQALGARSTRGALEPKSGSGSGVEPRAEPWGKPEGLGLANLVGTERRELDLVALARSTAPQGTEEPDLTEKFATQLAQRVVAQAAAGQWTSRVALNPAQLGPLEIRLQLEGDRLSVHFQAQHALTRELLSDGLGRLREGLEQAGFDVARLTSDGRGPGGQGAGSQAGTGGGASFAGGFEGSGSSAGAGGQGSRPPGEEDGGRRERAESQGTATPVKASGADSSGLDITV